MLAILAAVLAAVAAFLVAGITARVVGSAAARWRALYARAASEFGWELLLFVDPRQLRVLGLCGVFAGALAGALALGAPGAAALGAGGYFAPGWLARHQRRRRLARFESQLGDALPALAGALRAGLTLPQALDHVVSLARDPLRDEFSVCVREMKLGSGVDDALAKLGQRVPSEALALVIAAASIARQLGGNLAEVFETISGTIRERIRLQGRVDALTAQGRMQGWIIGLLPVALGFALDAIRPDLVEPMFDHWFGWALAAAVVAMEAAGVVVIRRVIAIEV